MACKVVVLILPVFSAKEIINANSLREYFDITGHDVAKGTYLMHLLKMAFENAFLILHKAVTDSAATKM